MPTKTLGISPNTWRMSSLGQTVILQNEPVDAPADGELYRLLNE